LNTETTIDFEISGPGMVSLKIYTFFGQAVAELANTFMQPGIHTYTWNSSPYSAGIYFYRLFWKEHSVTKTLVIAK
jgi:hypothetical protein